MTHYSKRNKRDPKGKKDLVIMCVIAVILIFALAYVLINIVRQSEKHVEKVRNTKVQYEESLSWRPDKSLCEKRILKDLDEDPDKTKGTYTGLELNEDSMKTIGKMKNLRNLELRHSVFENEWLNYLVKLPLRDLDVYGTKTNDRGIRYLVQLKELRTLNIGDTTLSDEGLELLATLPHLTSLDLNATKVTDDGIKFLENKKLVDLTITDTKATARCFDSIVKVRRLQRFSSGGIALEASDIKKLTSFKKLKILKFEDCGLEDEDMQVFKQFPLLNHLAISKNNISDNGLNILSDLKRIEILGVKGCPKISEEAVRAFKKKHPNCKVKYSKLKTDLPEDFPMDMVQEEMKVLEKQYLEKNTDNK